MDTPLATMRTLDWRAVTEPGEMSRWFPATVHAEPGAGAAMRFEFDPSDAAAYTAGEQLR